MADDESGKGDLHFISGEAKNAFLASEGSQSVLLEQVKKNISAKRRHFFVSSKILTDMLDEVAQRQAADRQLKHPEIINLQTRIRKQDEFYNGLFSEFAEAGEDFPEDIRAEYEMLNRRYGWLVPRIMEYGQSETSKVTAIRRGITHD